MNSTAFKKSYILLHIQLLCSSSHTDKMHFCVYKVIFLKSFRNLLAYPCISASIPNSILFLFGSWKETLKLPTFLQDFCQVKFTFEKFAGILLDFFFPFYAH